ncbi:two-component regulator propeller domain-containing protein, partial [Escherichia coli]|uniref:two-component regulator propeller domain-containing protein n=3 Tax=Pseudomonadati TaxID=3379134 RepID=UPI0022305732
MDIINPEIRSFVHTDFENGNSIRTNRIADLFVDDQKHIWVADYPEGVSMIDMDSPDDYKWYRFQAGNTHSLANNRINAVLHDSDGDVWFATDRGISCFHPSTGR